MGGLLRNFWLMNSGMLLTIWACELRVQGGNAPSDFFRFGRMGKNLQIFLIKNNGATRVIALFVGMAQEQAGFGVMRLEPQSVSETGDRAGVIALIHVEFPNVHIMNGASGINRGLSLRSRSLSVWRLSGLLLLHGSSLCRAGGSGKRQKQSEFAA